jgi:hypothetical protein
MTTKATLRQQLITHARANRPQLTDLDIRHRNGFAYVSGRLAHGTTMPLFRLRYTGSVRTWGFAIYLASRDSYQDSFLQQPSRHTTQSAHHKKHSTAPAASTSTTPQPGYPDELTGATTRRYEGPARTPSQRAP